MRSNPEIGARPGGDRPARGSHSNDRRNNTPRSNSGGGNRPPANRDRTLDSEQPPIVETEPEPSPDLDPTTQPSGLANEFKTIQNVRSPDPEPQPEMTGDDDDVLFDDAADQRTKKVAYY
jgi:hypothetical protein